MIRSIKCGTEMPAIGSIGVIFGRNKPNECEWYIIGDNGNAHYINEAQWFDYQDEGKEINQPVYCEY